MRITALVLTLFKGRGTGSRTGETQRGRRVAGERGAGHTTLKNPQLHARTGRAPQRRCRATDRTEPWPRMLRNAGLGGQDSHRMGGRKKSVNGRYGMWHQDINWACQRTVFHLCPTLPELPRSPNHNQVRLVRSRAGELLAPIIEGDGLLGDNTSCIPKNTPSLATCLVCHCPTLVPYFLVGHRLFRGMNLQRQAVLVSLVFTMFGCFGTTTALIRATRPDQTTHFPAAD
ncbi:hypothetical protein B0T09DRAFT_106528 [Sordaria sp. MPI-SDFR-AT-0083]|nr:hypothetical protein B0T09DRAFT_106528 [Sordaria sp. MPI-SDFR-AT-0083]